MQNINNMCEKFHYDRLRNDRALGNRKSDNNNPKNKNNVRIAIVALFPGPKHVVITAVNNSRYFMFIS